MSRKVSEAMLEEPMRFYAFIDSFEQLSQDLPRKDKLRRYALQLDCIEKRYFDGHDPNGKISDEDPYFLVRIISTMNRLHELCESFVDPDRGLEEGGWLEIELDPTCGGPKAWTLSLVEDQYTNFTRSNLSTFRFLNEEPAPDPVSAATSSDWQKDSDVQERYNFRNRASSRSDIVAALQGLPNTSQVTVHDVGQANFCSLENETGEVSYFFDVGWPLLWRNYSSVQDHPKPNLPNITDDSVVIISHWDWDHFSLGRQDKKFHKLLWIAPAQKTGPGAGKLIEKLLEDNKILFFGDQEQNIPIKNCCLYKASGTRSDRNASGLVLIRNNGRKKILFTGDASYDYVNAGKQKFDGVVIPHHGSRSTHDPPKPRKGGVAVLSFGRNNCYNHPASQIVKQHRTLKWDMKYTAGEPRNYRGSGPYRKRSPQKF